MPIKKLLLLIGSVVTVATGWLVLSSDPVSASVFDGKACATSPIYALTECPPGRGVTDLTASQTIVVPTGSRCFNADDPELEDSPRAYACNYDTDPGDGESIFLGASTLRDTWMQRWMEQNPGQGTPSEGQWMLLVNETVANELEGPSDETPESCDALSGYEQARCEAIRACEDAGGDSECTSQFDACMDGSTDVDRANECADEIAPDENQSLCQVEGGLSWILCPIMNTIAAINDNLWQAIEAFLVIPGIDTSTSSDNAIYQAWSLVRNIANVLFVIAFLLIIYSQLTSAGISNYGIKKMLPRLIVGAILVNTSFWLTIIATDISNIVGSSTYSVINSVAPTLSAGGSEPGTWSMLVGNILAGGALVGGLIWAGFAILFPLAVSAIFFLFGLVATLAFRHAALIVLIVLAPIAAVAYMLPNTDKFSKSWWGLFKLLLYLYPIIALVVAVGDIAGTVIFQAAQNMQENSLPKFFLMATGVAAPAFAIIAIPSLVKATAGILGRFGVSNPFGGIAKMAKDRAGDVGGRMDKRVAAYGARTNEKDGGFRRATRFGARWVPGASRRSRRNVYDKIKDQQFDADVEAGARGTNKGRKLNSAADAAGQRLETVKVNAEVESLKTNKELHVNATIDRVGLDTAKSNLTEEANKQLANNTAGAATRAALGDKDTAEMIQAQAQSSLDKRTQELVDNARTRIDGEEHETLMARVKDTNLSKIDRMAAAAEIGGRSFRRGQNELIDHLADSEAYAKEEDLYKKMQLQAMKSSGGKLSSALGDTDKKDLALGKLGAKGKATATFNDQPSIIAEKMKGRVDTEAFSVGSLAAMDHDDATVLQHLQTTGQLTDKQSSYVAKMIGELRQERNSELYANTKEKTRKIFEAWPVQPSASSSDNSRFDVPRDFGTAETPPPTTPPAPEPPRTSTRPSGGPVDTNGR